MEQSSDDESSFAEIMRLKRSNRERLILGIQNASLKNLRFLLSASRTLCVTLPILASADSVLPRQRS